MNHVLTIDFMSDLCEYTKQVNALRCLRGLHVDDERTCGNQLVVEFDSTIGNIGLLFITLDAYKVAGVVSHIEL